MNIKIAPSILASDFSEAGKTVRRLETCGADLVHCDVMDGNFVPPITFGDQMVRALRPHTALPLDCHLMVTKPWERIEAFAAAGADLITIHVEACGKDTVKVMEDIRTLGKKASAVVNPATPAEALFDCVEAADMLLLMSVVPGWGGQKFIPETLKKIETLRNFCIRAGKPELDIEVDGGIGADNVKEVIAAGANVIVAGSAVFKADDMADMIRRLRG